MRRSRLHVFILLSVILVVGAVSYSQEVGRLELRDFQGVYNALGPLTIKPNQAMIANNIMLSNPDGNVGSLSKRLGYDSVSALPVAGYDSIINIYHAPLEDGRRFLVAVADSADSCGFGNVVRTAYGSADLSSYTRLINYWNCQNIASFAMLRGVLYGVNGVQKGFYYDGKATRSYPLVASGEPKIVPLAMPDTGIYYDTTHYYLDGEYRYAVLLVGYYDTTETRSIGLGPVSLPMRASHGHMYLAEFQYPQGDSVVDEYDSVDIYIVRSQANSGSLDNKDAFYALPDTMKGVTAAEIGALTYIDSLPDSIIVADGTPIVETTRNARYGVDSLGAYNYDRYGAPTFLDRDSAHYDSAFVDTSKYGIYVGMPTQRDTLGVVYMIEPIDTANYIPGDSSRSLFVYEDTPSVHDGNHAKSIKIQLPTRPAGVCWNIYRAHILQIGRDTSAWKLVLPPGGDRMRLLLSVNPVYRPVFAVDTTVVGVFYLIKQIGDTTSTYTDSLRFDSLITHPPYRQRTPIVNFSQVWSDNGYIYGMAGSRVYRSQIDSASNFMLTNFLAMNEGDGDEGKVAWATQFATRYMKNNSNFNIYDDFTKTEVNGFWGCVAPQSHTAGVNGDYYVTANGIVLETRGENLQRTFKTGLISDRLAMFATMPMTTKQKIVAQVLPKANKVFFDVPFTGGDTVLIWDEIANGFTTATGFSFGGATLYDTSSVATHTPANTMYFFKRGGRTLYTYGTSNLDNGVYIQAQYESGPLLTDYGYEEVRAVGLTTHSADSTNKIFVQMLSDKDANLHTAFTLDSFNLTYTAKEFRATPSWFTKIRLYTDPGMAFWTTTVIDGIDIFFKKADEPQFK